MKPKKIVIWVGIIVFVLIVSLIIGGKRVSHNDRSNQKIVPVPSEKENSSTPDAGSVLYDNANELVTDVIQNSYDWSKEELESSQLDCYYINSHYKDTTLSSTYENRPYIKVNCFDSINEAIDTESSNYNVLFGSSGFELTHTSYSGLDSDTYVKGDSTRFIARVQNC